MTTVAPAATATAWPKKLPEQIAAIRDLVARTHEAWTIDRVCAAFKGAKKTDVEEVHDSLEVLGLLTGYTHHSTRRWKSGAVPAFSWKPGVVRGWCAVVPA